MNNILQELLSVSLYKRNQGRITRQVTFGAIVVALAIGTYRMKDFMMIQGNSWHWSFGIPSVLLVIGVWVTYRLVNIPAFADFLIAVEAEMNKVSWPTRYELVRASIVVLVTMFALTVMLLVFDSIWKLLFQLLHII